VYVNDEIESPDARLPLVTENELVGFVSPYVTDWLSTVNSSDFAVIMKFAPVKELIV
jgi:hypothetical protein